jgi:NAD-dependent dihydropyrimidine dehydrogenase PreA subunit
MGEFIEVQIDLTKCENASDVSRWVQVCPVNIFEEVKSKPVVVEENEDECTLCMLCIEAFPEGAIKIIKLYDD